jgi:hypothetical protein
VEQDHHHPTYHKNHGSYPAKQNLVKNFYKRKSTYIKSQNFHHGGSSIWPTEIFFDKGSHFLLFISVEVKKMQHIMQKSQAQQ